MPETDDTPLWVEVLDVVFGPALIIRTFIMLMIASDIAELDAAIPDNDITLQNPICAFRGTKYDLPSRIVTSFAGIALWATTPISLPTPSMGLLESVAISWMFLNCVVLWADPLALTVLNLTNRETTDSTKPTDIQ